MCGCVGFLLVLVWLVVFFFLKISFCGEPRWTQKVLAHFLFACFSVLIR